MPKRFDPMFYGAVAIGAAVTILARPKGPIGKTQLAGNMLAALGVGMTLPDVVVRFWPTSGDFLPFVGFACAVGGIGVSQGLMRLVPRLLARYADKLVDGKDKEDDSENP